MKKFIGVRTSFKGTHCWPMAKIVTGRDEIGFLETPHRHVFFVEVEVEVDHNDRALEFFLFQSEVEKIIVDLYKSEDDSIYYSLGSRSCEMICEEIINEIRKNHNLNMICVSVSEDNENYGKVKYGN